VILEARGLVRRYGSAGIAGVDLAVEAGEILGVLGPNGAGKSTLFRLLSGAEAPDAGQVLLAGADVTGWPLHRRARAGLAWLPQGPSVLPRLTVRENLALALAAVGRTAELAERLAGSDLVALAGRKAGQLSGGERRRLEIARALALSPRAVLLDEPFAGVDPRHVADLSARIRQMAADGRAVVLTDHAVREALAVCDRAILLDGGVVQAEGTAESLAKDPRARSRYLGTLLDPT
jgi:lipopolysaccharide export system ATP-binding protein